MGQKELCAYLLASIISYLLVLDHTNNPLRMDHTSIFHILLAWLGCSKAESSWKDN